MQSTATVRASVRDYDAAIGGYFARIRRGFSAYLDRLSRADQIRKLDAMSDEELARIGIGRDDIVRYVFRDKLLVS